MLQQWIAEWYLGFVNEYLRCLHLKMSQVLFKRHWKWLTGQNSLAFDMNELVFLHASNAVFFSAKFVGTKPRIIGYMAFLMTSST